MRKNIAAGESGSIYLFAICAASLLSYIFTLILSRFAGVFAGMSIASWVGYVIIQIGFVAVVLIFSSLRKFDLKSVAAVKPFTNYKRYLLLIPITIMTIVVFLPLSQLFARFLNVMGYPDTSPAMPDFQNAGVYIMSLIIMAVIPACGEELLMRGTVLSGLTTRGVGFGVLISALLFSMMHANPVQTVHQFGLGIVLALVFLMSGSIVPCVLIHFLNNFISLTISAYIPQIDAIFFNLGNWLYLTGAASVVLGSVILAALLYLYYRSGKRRNDGNPFRVVENGIVYDEYSIYATQDVMGHKVKTNVFKDTFAFIGSLFTASGWKRVGTALGETSDIPQIGKAQPMISVWLAVGFAVIYWFIAFLTGIII